ncbi:hypothetical protein [Macrococcus bovicus]|uniref:Uncharacterized protein n=1 Tax=Macrococcus bovicus TaxID=69968 RepID=A0A4R6BW66_9STAP|nr:hypothetical protein [Macrococcus bovicus]TDM12646.1 hypothetical protein ERX55_10335 [Macrococcus bovicus]
MNKKHMMVSAHRIAQRIVKEVGNYSIALSLALKEVWRQVKTYNKKRFGWEAIYSAERRLCTPKQQSSNKNVGGVPEWIIRKNLTTEEAFAVINSYSQVTIRKETEKAVLVDFHTDWGHVSMWCPKSVMAA